MSDAVAEAGAEAGEEAAEDTLKTMTEDGALNGLTPEQLKSDAKEMATEGTALQDAIDDVGDGPKEWDGDGPIDMSDPNAAADFKNDVREAANAKDAAEAQKAIDAAVPGSEGGAAEGAQKLSGAMDTPEGKDVMNKAVDKITSSPEGEADLKKGAEENKEAAKTKLSTKLKRAAAGLTVAGLGLFMALGGNPLDLLKKPLDLGLKKLFAALKWMANKLFGGIGDLLKQILIYVGIGLGVILVGFIIYTVVKKYVLKVK